MAAVFIRETGESIALDNTFDVTVTYASTISEHPVESGANVADHSQPRTPEIVVSGLVTESPRVVPGREVTYEGADNRAREIIASLVAAKNDGALLTAVLPGHGVFENVVVASIRPSVTNIKGTRFNITLRQIRIAERITVQIPPLRPNPEAAPGLADETNRGRVNTSRAATQETARRSSTLYSVGTITGRLK